MGFERAFYMELSRDRWHKLKSEQENNEQGKLPVR